MAQDPKGAAGWPRLMRAVTAFGLAALLAVLPEQGLAQGDEYRLAIGAHLLYLTESEEHIDEHLDVTFGPSLTTAQREVLRPLVRALYRHPAFVDDVSNRLRAMTPSGKYAEDDARTAIGASGAALFKAGIVRLPGDRQKRYLEILRDYTNSLPGSGCAALLDPKRRAKEVVDPVLRSILNGPVSRLADYVELQKEAVLAELKNSPPAPRLTAERARLADEAFDRKMVQMAAEQPQLAAKWLSAAEAPTQGRNACVVAGMPFDVIIELDEPYRRSFVQTMMKNAH